MVNHNATEGTMTATTTHLTKVGNAYATTDLRYRVTKNSSNHWVMFDAKRGTTTRLWTAVKSEALTSAERIININIAEEALPWDRVTDTPAKWWTHKRDYEYGDLNCCQCCGRKVGANPLGAIIVDGGSRMCLPADSHAFMENDGGYMGWYPVGAECAKQFPEGYLTTLSGN